MSKTEKLKAKWLLIYKLIWRETTIDPTVRVSRYTEFYMIMIL